jgi:hypothetical protein
MAQSYYPAVLPDTWLNLRLTNRENMTGFSINDSTIIRNISTPDLVQGRIGLFAEDNQAWFDDVDVAAKTAGPYTGLNNFRTRMDHLMIYPNPVNGQKFSVLLQDPQKGEMIKIYDLLGRLVHACSIKSPQTTIPASVLSQPGMYILKVSDRQKILISSVQ